MGRLERYTNLKRQVDDLQRERDRSLGALTELTSRLADYNCKDLAEAKRLLKRLRDEIAKRTKEHDQLLDEFEAKYGEQLAE